jgi:hypothetical protein
MIRKLFVTVGVLLLGAGGLWAAEGFRATVQKIDFGRKVIVVKTGSTERFIKVDAAVTLKDERGKDISFTERDLADRGFRDGRKVVIVAFPTPEGTRFEVRLLP